MNPGLRPNWQKQQQQQQQKARYDPRVNKCDREPTRMITRNAPKHCAMEVLFGPVQHIPSRDLVQLSLTPVVVASIPTSRANQLIKLLSASAPLPSSLRHLKRVRKCESTTREEPALDIILSAYDQQQHCPLESGTGADAPCADLLLPDSLAAVVKEHQLQPLLLHVPQHPPQTREQWQEWSKLWPITWKIPEHPVQLPPVDAQEQQYFEQHMAAALRFASAQRSSNAALIVDPLSSSIVAQAVNNAAHPLDHAAMVTIRAAAARDKQMWPVPASDSAAQPPSNPGRDGSTPMTEAAGAGPEDQAGMGKHSSPAGEEGACKRLRLQAGDASEHEQPLDHAGQQQRAVEGAGEAQDQQGLPGSERPYMCTGYDCFLVREPCIMCAMALVHSRLQRVVYCQQDAQYGALGGSCRLHAQRSLNHHYLVYHLPMLEEQKQAQLSVE